MEIGRNGIPSFAKTIRVLIVDRDKRSLQSIASMLQSCAFKVTTTEEADEALKMVIEEKHEPFNLIMANSIESNFNSLSVLHQTGIPIILMSPEMDMKTAASRAMTEWPGCHFLKKPISMEDIELVRKIVYRKIRNPRGENLGKKSQIDGMFGRIVQSIEEEEEEEEEEEKGKCREGEGKSNQSVNGEEDMKTNNRNDQRTNKKSRIVWNSKLHRKFTEALSKLGNRKSSPKIILKMMDEPTLTLRQVASHLQKFKSQVKHLNKITASDASSSTSVVKKNQLQSNSITNTLLNQPNYTSNNYITNHNNMRQLQAPTCFNQDVFNSHLMMMMMNQNNNSNSYRPISHPNHHLQIKSYGGLFEAETNLVEGSNHIFTNELYTNESFVQTSDHCPNYFQCFGADEDYCSFLSADHELEFDQNLAAGCFDADNNVVASGACSVIAGRSLNQNVALKELDDLLNNTEEDPMVYCCYDGEMNSFEIDQFSEWLNA